MCRKWFAKIYIFFKYSLWLLFGINMCVCSDKIKQLPFSLASHFRMLQYNLQLLIYQSSYVLIQMFGHISHPWLFLNLTKALIGVYFNSLCEIFLNYLCLFPKMLLNIYYEKFTNKLFYF